MKIGVNATVLTPSPSGVGVFTFQMCQALARYSGDLLAWVLEPNLAPAGVGCRLAMSSLPVVVRQSAVCRALWDQVCFPAEVRAAHIDVVFFPMQEGMIFPPVPQIVFVHDLAPLKCPAGIPASRRWSYRTRVPLVLRRSAAVTVPTESVRAEVLETYRFLDPEKVWVLGEGYDDTHFRPLAQPRRLIDGRYFLFLGNRCENKNLLRVVEAFADLNEPSVKLVLVGRDLDPGYRSRLDCLVAAKQLHDSVVVLDYLPYDKLPDLYSGAEALLLTSTYEGFGLPIIEGMACGTPVITSGCSAMAEVAGDAALLVDPYSTISIASAMKRVLEGPELRAELRRLGQKRARMFQWDQCAERLYNLCQTVLGDSGCNSLIKNAG